MSRVTTYSIVLVVLGAAVSIIAWGSSSWVGFVTAQSLKTQTLETEVVGLKNDIIEIKLEVKEIKSDVKWISRKLGKE